MKNEVPHYGQIITTRKMIIEYMRDMRHSIVYNTVILLALGQRMRFYKLRLYDVCSKLQFLSRLVYEKKDGIGKLEEGKYLHELFDEHAETPEEILSVLEYWDEACGINIALSKADIKEIFAKLQIIEKLWGRFMSCKYELPFIGEFAYAFEYVYDNGGWIVPIPEYSDEYTLFPCNYKCFNYWTGISEFFLDISECNERIENFYTDDLALDYIGTYLNGTLSLVDLITKNNGLNKTAKLSYLLEKALSECESLGEIIIKE